MKDNCKKWSIMIVSALIAALFSISGNNYSIETISSNYLKEVKASEHSNLTNCRFQKHYLPQSSSEAFPSPIFKKIAHQEFKIKLFLHRIEYGFYYQKIIYHKLNPSEIVFPTHFFW